MSMIRMLCLVICLRLDFLFLLVVSLWFLSYIDEIFTHHWLYRSRSCSVRRRLPEDLWPFCPLSCYWQWCFVLRTILISLICIPLSIDSFFGTSVRCYSIVPLYCNGLVVLFETWFSYCCLILIMAVFCVISAYVCLLVCVWLSASTSTYSAG